MNKPVDWVIFGGVALVTLVLLAGIWLLVQPVAAMNRLDEISALRQAAGFKELAVERHVQRPADLVDEAWWFADGTVAANVRLPEYRGQRHWLVLFAPDGSLSRVAPFAAVHDSALYRGLARQSAAGGYELSQVDAVSGATLDRLLFKNGSAAAYRQLLPQEEP